MPEPILIGITGLAGSGKDTTFGLILDWTTQRRVLAARRALADSLKLSFARLFYPQATMKEALAWVDNAKNSASIEISDTKTNESTGQATTLSDVISLRLALQRYGTECHRQLFNPDFWLDLVVPPDFDFVENFLGEYESVKPQVCVVTDIRFDNEAQRILDAGGIMINVHRFEEHSGDGHASEAGVSPELITHTINNTTGMQNLQIEVELFCDAFIAPLLEPVNA